MKNHISNGLTVIFQSIICSIEKFSQNNSKSLRSEEFESVCIAHIADLIKLLLEIF
jgi:hypothetical protein